MCGFTGFCYFKTTSNNELIPLINKMGQEINHRGPDSSGTYTDESIGLAISHQRLAIVDLSSNGHQPMTSRNGRYVIAYNGEIYNSQEIKTELLKLGYTFMGTSDTEVILEAICHYGLQEALRKFIGMFAFVLYDIKQKEIFLIRDRLGIKPVYWGFNNNTLFFGSELKSFKIHPKFKKEIDENSLSLYFKYNYIPTPYSIYKDIKKLKPGSFVKISNSNTISNETFWDLNSIIAKNRETNIKPISVTDLLNSLEDKIENAVSIRMLADVPLGAFLSGGIDSSLVVALMQKNSINPIKTFSIGFYEKNYNEAPFAKNIANHLGTNHHELILEQKQALEIIPSISKYFDEPFADSSQIPTMLVSKLAKSKVTVSLSGDGGDEVFAGYNRYLMGANIWDKIKVLPSSVRKILACSITSMKPENYDKIANFLPTKLLPSAIGDKAHKLANVINAKSNVEFYENLISFWPKKTKLLNSEIATFSDFQNLFKNKNSLDFIEQMQYIDTQTYLPDDILTKVDRASMAYSLEARVPLIDHRVIELAWQLSTTTKIKQNKGKWPLRQILQKYVPQELFDRPKMGFGLPIDKWLKNDLKDWAEDLLSYDSLKKSNLLPEPIRARWEDHLSGKRNWQYSLWGVLMYQDWHRRYFT